MDIPKTPSPQEKILEKRCEKSTMNENLALVRAQSATSGFSLTNNDDLSLMTPSSPRHSQCVFTLWSNGMVKYLADRIIQAQEIIHCGRPLMRVL